MLLKRKYLMPSGAVIISLANNSIFPLVTNLQETLRVDRVAANALISAFYLPLALLMPVLGALVAIYGRRRLLLWGLWGLTLGSLSVAVADSYLVALGGRLLQGISAALVMPSLLASLADEFAEHQRGEIIGYFMFFITFGSFAGPLAAGWLTQVSSWRWTFLALAVFSLFFIPLYRRILPQDVLKNRSLGNLAGELKASLTSLSLLAVGIVGAAVFLVFIGAVTLGSELLAGPTFALREGIVGTILSLSFGAGALGSLAGGFLADRKGRTAAGVGGLIIMTLGTILLIGSLSGQGSLVLLTFGLLILGLGHTVTMTPLQVLSVEILPDHREAATSLFNSIRFLGYAVAPLAVAYLQAPAGVIGTFVVLLAIILASTILLLGTGTRVSS